MDPIKCNMHSSENEEHISDDERVQTNEIGESDEDNDSGSDSDHDDENNASSTNDDDDDGSLRYLFDKDAMKQHAFAIFVALAATAVAYLHLIPTYGTASSGTAIPIPSAGAQIGKRQVPLKPTEVHHHHAFQRTENIFFCPTGLVSLSDSHEERIERALALSNPSNAAQIGDIDPNLQLFQFNFPKQFTDILNDYYVADEVMDDFYNRTLGSNNDMTDNINFQCLIDATIENQHKSTVPMNTIAYIHPDINAYYRDTDEDIPKTLSVQKILKEKRGEIANKRESVSLTYTGFTAKFINISTKPMLLFWDGKNKPKLRAKIEPFESFSTVTFPGNSFYITPVYDKEHAMERWVMTVDEAVVAYDALSNDEVVLQKLSMEKRKLYDMQKLNLDFAREYLAVARKNWLSMFPRSRTMHHMWNAGYFGQEYIVRTDQTHFNSMPSDKRGIEEVWKMLDYADYDRMVDESEKGGNTVLNLPQHRKKDPLDLKMTVVSVAPRVFEIDNFLSELEVDHLIEMATRYNATNPDQNAAKRKKRNASRTNAWIRREISPIVDAIYHRSANILNIDESLLRHRNEHEQTELNTHHSIGEAIHVTQFVTGQGYVPRSDSKQTSVKNRYQPNRFATIFFFLNDVHEDQDGDTVFPLAVSDEKHDGIRIVPKKGKAVLLYNMLPDGNVDDLSHHASAALQQGEKWMGTLYIWDPIID